MLNESNTGRTLDDYRDEYDRLTKLEKELESLKKRVESAVRILLVAGMNDAGHHKQDGIHKAMTELLGEDEFLKVIGQAAIDGEFWDVGVPG